MCTLEVMVVYPASCAPLRVWLVTDQQWPVCGHGVSATDEQSGAWRQTFNKQLPVIRVAADAAIFSEDEAVFNAEGRINLSGGRLR